ncbi:MULTISPECIES: CPBP family intramembrane glutamic endopeptidase [Haloferacaceae]|uniref:CPBP family intramembrane glutamic endopeptidase n=1 Tax=Halorubrum glutamatedens TaxID=2707018 RepID=A0ABD5QW70_9EURY|nr:CPBP family intramembrane glutamic endopeptidase [Halobellus captivus]
MGVTWAAWHLPLFLNATTTHGGWPLSQQLLRMVSILAGSTLWTWMYNSTVGSVLAVAVFHAGINVMGIFHPADQEALIPNGAPDPWLNLLAEVTGAVPLVLVAILLVVVYGADRLANRDPPTPKTPASQRRLNQTPQNETHRRWTSIASTELLRRESMPASSRESDGITGSTGIYLLTRRTHVQRCVNT